MFVDIDENVSVLNRIKLTFVYDDVNNNADDEFGQVRIGPIIVIHILLYHIIATSMVVFHICS